MANCKTMVVAGESVLARLGSKKFFGFAVLVLTTFLATVMFGDTADAHWGTYNDSEAAAKNRCSGNIYNAGALWITASNNWYVDAEWHSTNVYVSGNQDSVTLYLRRSLYNCKSGGGMNMILRGLQIDSPLRISSSPGVNQCYRYGSSYEHAAGHTSDSNQNYTVEISGLKALSAGSHKINVSWRREYAYDNCAGDNYVAPWEYSTININRGNPDDWDIASISSVSQTTVDYKSSQGVTFKQFFHKWSGNASSNINGRYGFNEVMVSPSITPRTGTPPNEDNWANGGNGYDSSLFNEFTSLDLNTYYDSNHAYGITNTISYNPSASHTSAMSYLTRNSYMNADDVGKKICQRARFMPDSYLAVNRWESPAGDWPCVLVYSPWKINPTSTAKANAKAEPGSNKMVFTHKLTSNDRVVKDDNGDNVTITGAVYQYINDGNNKTKPTDPAKLTNVTGLVNVGANNKTTAIGERDTFYHKTSTRSPITQADVGKTVCQFVRSSKTSRENGNVIDSTPACLFIPYNYTLQPDTEIVSPGKSGDRATISYDDPAIFQGRVDNSGPTKSRPADWQAFTFVIPNADRTIPEHKNMWETGKQPTPASLLNHSSASLNSATISKVYGLTSTVTNYTSIGTRANKGRCTAAHSTRSVFYPTKKATADPGPTNNEIVCKTNDLADIVNTLNLGDRLCFALWVAPSWATPANQTANDRSYSKPSCLTIVKSPQLQLRGADSKSGAIKFGKTDLRTPPGASGALPNQYQGGFAGHASSNPLRGSWSQYGLLATGTGSITNFGSTGYTLNTNNAPKFCKLLFANTTGNGGGNCSGNPSTAEQYGNLNMLATGNGRTITLPRVAEQDKTTLINQHQATELKAVLPVGNTRNLNNLASGTYYITADTVITASVLQKNQHLVLVVPDSTDTNTNTNYSVTITGNITAGNANGNATYASLDEIPSLTIIANNIYVDGSVASLLGTYIARDRFHTCANPALSTQQGFQQAETFAGLGEANKPWSGKCKPQLTINGAVISKNRPNFQRTYGAGRAANDPTGLLTEPAEILNYTPNTYLTSYALSQMGNSNDWKLTDLRQLPARL